PRCSGLVSPSGSFFSATRRQGLASDKSLIKRKNAFPVQLVVFVTLSGNQHDSSGGRRPHCFTDSATAVHLDDGPRPRPHPLFNIPQDLPGIFRSWIV